MIPAHYQLAKDLVGVKEYPGKKRNNQTIMDMYADLGHSWVENDETPWCAAFVGSCLEEAGIQSTKKLNARSYLKWGKRVTKPKIGDVVIFKRGNSSWMGHVGFYAGQTKTHIKVLGGNQSNKVKISNYSKTKLLGFRRAEEPDLEIEEVDDNAPPEERKTLKDSWTLKGLFMALVGMVTALAEVFQNLPPTTQALLIISFMGIAIAAFRRWDANRTGKIG